MQFVVDSIISTKNKHAYHNRRIVFFMSIALRFK